MVLVARLKVFYNALADLVVGILEISEWLFELENDKLNQSVDGVIVQEPNEEWHTRELGWRLLDKYSYILLC